MLTEDQLSRVEAVHRRVFRIFEYKTDKDQYDKLEHWMDTAELEAALQRGKLVGDCDDFALACRHLLWDEGIPNRLVLCEIPGYGGHLVLEVEGYILDNNHDRVMRRQDLNYKWIKLSGYNIGEPWLEITG